MAELARRFYQDLRDDLIRLARTVMPWRATAVAGGAGPVTVRRIGQQAADGQAYPRLAGFDVAANDDVVLIELDGRPLALGAIVRSAPAGHRLSVPLSLVSGASLIGYSDGGTAETLRLDPAAGVVQAQALRPGGASGRRVLAGSNDPEGVVTGDSGDCYLRSGGAALAPLYLKRGSGNRGWLPLDGAMRERWECGAHANPGAASLSALGTATWSTTGTATSADDATGPWLGLATAATNDSVASVVGPSVARKDWATDDVPVEAMFVVKLASTATLRFWLGLFSGDPSGSNTPALSFVGFRYVAGAETDYRCYAGDGTNRSQAGSGVTVDTNPHTFRVVLGNSVARYYIDGAYVGELATNLPAATALLAPRVTLTTLEAVAKNLRFGACRIISR